MEVEITIKLTKFFIILFFLPFLVPLSFSEQSHIEFVDKQSSYFAGESQSINIKLSPRHHSGGTLRWRMYYKRNIFSQGEIRISDANVVNNTFSISVNFPQIRDGVILPALLQVGLYEDNSNTPVGLLKREIQLYGKDPFYQKMRWLENLNIFLFDPIGNTASIFISSNIPFTPIKTIDSNNEFDNGILIVGEGVSLKNYRGLSDVLLKFAESGSAILCLALSSGDFTLGSPNEGENPKKYTLDFDAKNIIKKFDKKFNSVSWAHDGKIITSSISLVANRNDIVAHIQPGNTGWPWMSINYVENHGKVVFAGFSIIEKWSNGPTPRYLFEKILNYTIKNDFNVYVNNMGESK